MKNSLLVPVVFISNFILVALAFSLSVGIWQYLMYGAMKGMFFYAFLHCLYLILPIACIIAIFAVYVFMMRHPQKNLIPFLFLIITFVLFFALLIPLVYSQGEKINAAFNAQDKVLIEDVYLESFIEQPAFVQGASKLLKPFLYDIYGQYRNSYLSYVIFAGSIFLLIFAFWGFTISTEWKIVNFSLFPFFLILMLYAYSYIREENFILNLRDIFPIEIPAFWIIPLLFFCTALIFFIYTIILLFVINAKTGPKKIKAKGLRPKPDKRKKIKKEVAGDV